MIQLVSIATEEATCLPCSCKQVISFQLFKTNCNLTMQVTFNINLRQSIQTDCVLASIGSQIPGFTQCWNRIGSFTSLSIPGIIISINGSSVVTTLKWSVRAGVAKMVHWTPMSLLVPVFCNCTIWSFANASITDHCEDAASAYDPSTRCRNWTPPCRCGT